MHKQTKTLRDDVGTLTEDARALLDATAEVAGEKVGEARKRLAAALERGQEMCGRVREKAADGAKAADEVVRKHPYQAMGVALAVGGLIGYVMAHRRSRNRD